MRVRSIAAWIRALLLLSFSVFVASCGGGGGSSGGSLTTPSGGGMQSIVITVSPATASLAPGGTQQFAANVTGTSNTGVTWSAGGVQGGNSTLGTISSLGLYTAPASLPNPIGIKIVATSVADGTTSGTALARVHDNVEFQNSPVKLGTSGGNFTDKNTIGNMMFCCSGTLGSLVSRSGNFYILSNNHVLGKSDQAALGEPISQPGLADTNCGRLPTTTVATLSQMVPLNSQNNVDAALAMIAGQAVDTTGSILDLGGIGQAAPPSATLAIPSARQPVSKSGDATGLTCSTIDVVNALIQVTYSTQCQGGTSFKVNFDNQVSILGNQFSGSGDSGSLIITSDKAQPVALLYAGSDTGTVGNPIQAVLGALKDPNTGEVPRIVGGTDHSVPCPATTSQSQVSTIGPQDKTGLPQSEISRATLARNHRMFELMQDSAVDTVDVGRSADNPDESAIVVTLRGQTSLPIPAQVDGVRTRIVQSVEFNALHAQARQVEALSPISETEIARARSAKQQHAEELMTNSAIIGVGVGASNDSPGESAIVVFVEKGKSVAVPAVIDGVRTRVITTDPFRTFNWGKSTVKACSRR